MKKEHAMIGFIFDIILFYCLIFLVDFDKSNPWPYVIVGIIFIVGMIYFGRIIFRRER